MGLVSARPMTIALGDDSVRSCREDGKILSSRKALDPSPGRVAVAGRDESQDGL